MVSYKVVSVAVVAFVALQIVSISAGDKMPQCKGVDVKMTEEQMMNLKDCAKQTGVTSMKMTPEQMACLSKCILEKKKLVDADGKPHKENILKLFDASMQGPVKEDLKMHLEKCLDEHASKVNAADATCLSYQPLSKCVHDSFMGICKS